MLKYQSLMMSKSKRVIDQQRKTDQQSIRCKLKKVTGLPWVIFSILVISIAFLSGLFTVEARGDNKKNSINPCVVTLGENLNHSFKWRAAEELVTAVELRDRLVDEKAKDGPHFLNKYKMNDLAEIMIVIANGVKAGNSAWTPYEAISEALHHLGYSGPKTANGELDHRFEINQDWFRTTWIKENILYKKVNILDLVYNEILKRDINWPERVQLFKKYLSDPRTSDNDLVSLYLLDPILGIDSLQSNRVEHANSSSLNFRYRSELTGVGFRGQNLWTNYRWLKSIFSRVPKKDNDLVIDIGSGLGRVGLYIAAMYPNLKFRGLEIIPERLAYANAAAKRFGLEDRIQFVQSDLSKDDLPNGDIYYYYNSLSEEPYKLLLKNLKTKARFTDFYLLAMNDANNQLSTASYLNKMWSTDFRFYWSTYPDSIDGSIKPILRVVRGSIFSTVNLPGSH